MELSTLMSQLISESLLAVQRHPQHDLKLGYRQAIWAELGTYGHIARSMDFIGHKRRTILAIFAARNVIPLWKHTWPADDRPSQLLTKAEWLMNGIEAVNEATEYGDRFWTWLEQSIGEYEDKTPLYVGASAVKALFVALQDEKFDPTDINFQRTDADVDVYDLDASYFAAAAYAHGSIWEPQADPAKRRAFWEWWLNEAVPNAWFAVSGEPPYRT